MSQAQTPATDEGAPQGLRVGLIGLGLMGGPISKRFLSKGLPLTCYDIDEAALADARRRGASTASNPAEVARGSDATFVIVPTADDARSVCLGEDGLLAGAAEGSVIVLCSSLKPAVCAEIAERGLQQNVKVIDAPMTGGISAAEDGTMTLLVGGDEGALEKARPAMQAIATVVHHLGPIGAGQIGKTVNNLIHWGEVVVITESLALGAKLGVDPSRLRPALIDASVDSRSIRALETMRLTWHAKDLADAMEMAEEVGAALPTAAVVRERMKLLTQERVIKLLNDDEGWASA